MMDHTIEIQEKEKEQSHKDYEFTVKGLKLDVVDTITSLNLPTSLRKIIYVDDIAKIQNDAERKTKLFERISQVKELFDKAVADEVLNHKMEFLKGKTPPSGNSISPDFQYEHYKKNKNVNGMIKEKFAKYY